MPDMMRAVVKTKKGPGAELMRVPIPSYGPTDVLIKVKATSVCGTDYHIYSWDEWSERRVRTPQVMGHEFCGVVEAVGSQVGSVKPGDLVSVETHIVCGRCYQCLTGQFHICTNTEIVGVDRDGCFAEYCVVPASNAVLNDPDLPPELGSILEPMGNAVHTAFAGPLEAQTVAVIGCGPIGLMSLAVARAGGAAKVWAVEPNSYRQALARELGADEVLNPLELDVALHIRRQTDGAGADVVLEMSGHPAGIKQAWQVARNGARVSLLGIPSKPVEVDLTEDIIFKGLTVQGITGRKMFDTWIQMKAMIRHGRLNVRPVITHRLPLEEFDKAFALMKQGNCGKVVMFPEGVPSS